MRFGENVDVTASVLYQDTDQDDLDFYHNLLDERSTGRAR